jgi:hypothetical protein
MPFYYRIEVRERARPNLFYAVYEIDARSIQAAIEAAKSRFSGEYPLKKVENHSFQQAAGNA